MDFPGEKLVIKLWETVAERGIGSLFKPWQMRREGRASIELKREELLAIAQAEHDAARIRRGEISLNAAASAPILLSHDAVVEFAPEEQRVQDSFPQVVSNIVVADTLRREANVTRALLHAEESLESDPQVPPEANVDDDWLYRWRDSASQVSSEELQNLWGRILAGEIKAPGTYSLRAMEFLRNLSQEEAEAIAKLAPFVIGDAIYRGDRELLDGAEVTLGFLFSMQQLGVVAGVEGLGMSLTWSSIDKSRFLYTFTSNSKVLIVTADDSGRTITLPAYQITAIGKQVLRLVKVKPNVAYLKKVGEDLKGQGVSVELAEYIDVSPDQIRCFNGQKL